MNELKELARTSRDHAAALLKFVKQMDKPKSAGVSGGGPSDVAELLEAAKKEGKEEGWREAVSEAQTAAAAAMEREVQRLHAALDVSRASEAKLIESLASVLEDAGDAAEDHTDAPKKRKIAQARSVLEETLQERKGGDGGGAAAAASAGGVFRQQGFYAKPRGRPPSGMIWNGVRFSQVIDN